MHTVYGSDVPGLSPDIITYYHQDNHQCTVGYWDKTGELYFVRKYMSCTRDLLLDYPEAKHILLVGNPTGQLIDSQDVDDTKLQDYYSYFHVQDGQVVQSAPTQAGHVVLFKLAYTPHITSGSKLPIHLLHAVGVSQAENKNGVLMIRCEDYYHIVSLSDGSIDHSKAVSVTSSNEEILYKILAYYQEHGIAPSTRLSTSGIRSTLTDQLNHYLPIVDTLKIPAKAMTYHISDHSDIYLHYLAYRCVS